MHNAARETVSSGPYVGPKTELHSVRLLVRVQPGCRELYPWVCPDLAYPAATAAPGSEGILLLTERGPRFVFRWHFESSTGEALR